MKAINEINRKKLGLFYFKAGNLLFWAAWFSLAAITNILDFAFALKVLPTDWHFRSGNYLLVAGSFSIYHVPSWLMNLMFSGLCLIQSCAALVFFAAFFLYIRGQSAWRFINWAFTISIGLWALFVIMEEIFIAYAFEGTQRQLIILELVSFMSLHLLPDED